MSQGTLGFYPMENDWNEENFQHSNKEEGHNYFAMFRCPLQEFKRQHVQIILIRDSSLSVFFSKQLFFPEDR